MRYNYNKENANSHSNFSLYLLILAMSMEDKVVNNCFFKALKLKPTLAPLFFSLNIFLNDFPNHNFKMGNLREK